MIMMAKVVMMMTKFQMEKVSTRYSCSIADTRILFSTQLMGMDSYQP